MSKQSKAEDRRHAAQDRRFVSAMKNIQDPKPVSQVIITVFENMSVQVTGFPSDHRQAMQLMSMAQATVVEHFMRKAAAGEYPQKRNIVTPTTAQVVGLGKGGQ